MHRVSFISDRPWGSSEQHSIRAHNGSVHAPSEVLPAIPKKTAQAVSARDSVLPLLPAEAHPSRTGLSDTLPQTPLSLSFQYIPPPPPLPAFQRQRQRSSAMLPSSIPNTPVTPSTPQRSSVATGDERFVVLPWPLGERLLALLSTAQMPEERARGSEGGCSEGLPAYASDE